jgi:hypothetical protein
MGLFSGRPDRIGSGVLANPTHQQGFDYNAFTIPASNIGRFGNSGANILWNNPGQHFLLSLYKDFNITEKVKFRLNSSFNDPFNQHNWGGPNANISDVINRGIETPGGSLGMVSRSITLDGRLSF